MGIDNCVAKCVHGSDAECELCGEVGVPDKDMRECPECDGTGEVWEDKSYQCTVSCKACVGTGRVEK